MTRPLCSPELRAEQKFWLLQVTCQSENDFCAAAAKAEFAIKNKNSNSDALRRNIGDTYPEKTKRKNGQNVAISSSG
jgi:hypothetical protein